MSDKKNSMSNAKKQHSVSPSVGLGHPFSAEFHHIPKGNLVLYT